MSHEDKLEVIKNLAADYGTYEPAYSGRGMYGEYCAAIRCERGDVEDIREQASGRGVNGARSDAMGLGAIVYWPGVKEI